MTIAYVGLGSGTLVAPRELLRATFARTLAGALSAGIHFDSTAPLRGAYDDIANGLPSTGVGYVASAYNQAPGDTALTVDIRRSADGPALGAASIASALNALPDGFDLTRLQLVSPGEGAAAAVVNQAIATETVQQAPGVLDNLLTTGQSIGKWFLWVLAFVAIILALYLFR